MLQTILLPDENFIRYFNINVMDVTLYNHPMHVLFVLAVLLEPLMTYETTTTTIVWCTSWLGEYNTWNTKVPAVTELQALFFIH